MDIKVYQYDYTNKSEDEEAYVKLFMGFKPTQEVLEKLYFKMCNVTFKGEEFEELDDLIICEELFAFFNDCDRPNGQRFRSMCINDIIVIDDRMYICKRQGFEKCDYDLTSLQDRSENTTYTIMSRNLL